MSLQNSDKERLKGREKDQEASSSGQQQHPHDKKLLLGTVQFYEDILDSMQNTFVAVFNENGLKHQS